MAVLALFAGCGGDDGDTQVTVTQATPSRVARSDVPADRRAQVRLDDGGEASPSGSSIVGLTEQDIVLELGYKPIATTEWYGDQPYAVWPWAQKLLGDAKPTVLTNADGIQLEKIASLRPDLIIGVNAGLTKKDYDQLSQARADDRQRRRAARTTSRRGTSRSSWSRRRSASREEGDGAGPEGQGRLRQGRRRAPGVQGQDGDVQPERVLRRRCSTSIPRGSGPTSSTTSASRSTRS